MVDGDGDREDDAAAFEELAYRLALRAFDESDVPSDVARTLHAVAQRGFEAAQLHNSRQIVARLPAELLWVVFSLLSLKRRLRVLRVCNRWRAVGLANGLLWNHIDISRPLPFTEWQLQHSGSAPLHINAYSSDRKDVAHINLIAGMMSRAETLSIYGTAAQLSWVLDRPAPRLQELTVRSRGADRHTLDLEPADGVRWPALRKLDLWGIFLPNDLDLARFLPMSPRLESLYYSFGENNNDPGFAPLLISSLPHLREVRLFGTTRRLLTALPALHAVHEVQIDADGVDDDNPPLLLPSLLTRDATDLPVNAFIADDEIRVQLERGKRTLGNPSLADESWLFYESTVFRSLTSLYFDRETLPNRPFTAAPALRVIFIADHTLSTWRDYSFTWTTPALRTICIGCDLCGIDDGFEAAPIDRLELATILRDVFAFSAGRRLATLCLRNVVLSAGTEVEGHLLVEDLVEAVDVVHDLDWSPLAESMAAKI